MKNKIIASKNDNSRVSMGRFILFSFFMYPFWIIVVLYYDKLSEFMHSDSIANVVIFTSFAIVNYLFGQIKIKFYQIIVVLILTVIFIALYAVDMHRYYANVDSDYTLDVIEAFMFYIAGFPVILFAQFTTWIPFLIRFIWQNRKNADKLKWN